MTMRRRSSARTTGTATASTAPSSSTPYAEPTQTTPSRSVAAASRPASGCEAADAIDFKRKETHDDAHGIPRRENRNDWSRHGTPHPDGNDRVVVSTDRRG